MEERLFLNKLKNEVHFLEWKTENPKANVMISHGMAEHSLRYDDLAKYLNDNGFNVFAIDHIGHGKYAKILGHMGKDEFNLCVSNMNELIELINEETKLETFLLGHSMGSFLSQLYIERYHNIKGCILSGSSKATPLMKMGSIVASLVYLFSKEKDKPNNFMNNLSFGSYNKAFKNPKNDFVWLNRDEAEVEKYINDPLCGYVCSTSFFKYMCKGLKEMNSKKALKGIEKDLPILIHGGSMDPVSNQGKDLRGLDTLYKNIGLKNITLFVYDGAHHEIYNEINKQEVYKNTINFLNKNL